MNNTTLDFEKQPSTLAESEFVKIIKAYLPAEVIKEKFGDLDQWQPKGLLEPILTANDKDKLLTYKELEVWDLPADWKNQLARLKELEKNQADYEQKQAELKGWTDTFGQQTPQEVQAEITKLTARPDIPQATWEDYKDRKTLSEYHQIQTELDKWKNTFPTQAAEEVEEYQTDLLKKCNLAEQELKTWQRDFPQQTSQEVKQIKAELENNLSEWIQNWGQELPEVQKEWELLKKRPDIPITEKEFYDDYARRKNHQQSKLEAEELRKEQEKVKELREKNKKLWWTNNHYLKNERTRRYVLAEPVLTLPQARDKIAELLEATEKNWTDYFQDLITDQNFPLDLSLWEKDEEIQARQILEWIKEARVTLDYERLLERWSGGTEYNEKYDFDGSLYLLSKWLEVKDFQPPITN